VPTRGAGKRGEGVTTMQATGLGEIAVAMVGFLSKASKKLIKTMEDHYAKLIG
jgi:hypothetical protein